MHAFFSYSYLTARRLLSSAGGILVFAIAVLSLGWPHQAWAFTVGDMICSAHDNLGPFVDVLDSLAYLFGGVLIGTGAIMLKDHTDNPSNNPLHRGIARIVGGAGLMSLPFFASFITNTLLLSPGAGGAAVCAVGGVTAAGNGDVGLDVLMSNLVNNIEGPLIALISISSFIMGVLFIIRGLLKGAKYGSDPRANSVPHILAYLVIGGILIALSENFNQIFSSIFASDFGGFGTVDSNSSIVLSWVAVQNLGGSLPFATAIAAALTFFQLIGLIAFFRGWYIVKNAVEGAGQATMAQGFTHIIGGVMAINIYNMLEIFDTTFGTGLLG